MSDNPSVPFFAAPATFATSSSPSASESSSAAASSPPQTATVTLRLPLGTLFDGRDYTFVTESNVRGYEWTTKETGKMRVHLSTDFMRYIFMVQKGFFVLLLYVGI